jgi:EmrB/QacA subfamily drug resistance transporter
MLQFNLGVRSSMMKEIPMNDGATKKSTLLVTTLSSFLTPFMASSVTIALPSIASTFEMDAVLLSWVVTSYALTGAIFLVPFGKAADIYGRKKIFQYGIVLFTLSMILLPFSNSGPMLIVLRILQGFGSSMTYSTGFAILTSAFPAGERGKAMGINVAAVYFGLSLGPFLGGFLTQHFGWRSIFIASAPFCLIILYYALSKLKGEWSEATGEKFDLTGSVIYILALASVMYGFTLVPNKVGIGLTLLGVSGILIFIGWESKVESPVLELDLFRRNRIFAFSNLAALVHYSGTFAVTFLLSLYLQYIKGLTPQSAGLVLICQPIVQAIFSPFAGRLSDRIQPRIVASTGMFFTAVGIFFLVFLKETTTLPYIVVSLIVLGFGFSLFSSPNANSVMGSVEKKFFGIASAILSTMRQGGQMLNMAIVTVIFSIYIGRVQITPQYHTLFLKSSKIIFTISVVLCLAGILASLARGKR